MISLGMPHISPLTLGVFFVLDELELSSLPDLNWLNFHGFCGGGGGGGSFRSGISGGFFASCQPAGPTPPIYTPARPTCTASRVTSPSWLPVLFPFYIPMTWLKEISFRQIPVNNMAVTCFFGVPRNQVKEGAFSSVHAWTGFELTPNP